MKTKKPCNSICGSVWHPAFSDIRLRQHVKCKIAFEKIKGIFNSFFLGMEKKVTLTVAPTIFALDLFFFLLQAVHLWLLDCLGETSSYSCIFALIRKPKQAQWLTTGGDAWSVLKEKWLIPNSCARTLQGLWKWEQILLTNFRFVPKSGII